MLSVFESVIQTEQQLRTLEQKWPILQFMKMKKTITIF